MSILSFQFAAFLLAAFLVYFLTPGKHQWKSLLLLSCCFYLFAGAKAAIFVLVTSVSTFFAGRWMGRINAEFDVAVANYSGPNPKMTRAEKKALKAAEDKRKKKILVLALLLNFGILFALKYVDVLVDSVNLLGRLFHTGYEMPRLSFIVPLGISYYTFQAMGYLIDLYRRKGEPERSYPRFLLFIIFFPQLVQGPINRFDEFSPQLYQPHPFDGKRVWHGVELIFWGLFKKLVLADRISIIVSTVFGSPDAYPGFYLIFATILSELQLYMDFSGGIDMTRGVAEALGIIMPENFTRPFFARDVGEFWRRWHITLNNWWRDYIFYPINLSKPFARFGKLTKRLFGDDFGKKVPIFFSMIFIRLLNSIWHGATSVSVLSGFYYGILLVLALALDNQIDGLTKKLGINTECLTWRVFQRVRTFLLIAAPRLVIMSTSLSQAGTYIRNAFGEWNPWVLFDGSLCRLGVSEPQLNAVLLGFALVLIVSCLQEKGYVVREELDKQNLVFRGLIYIAFVTAIILLGAYGSGYNASAFVYQQV